MHRRRLNSGNRRLHGVAFKFLQALINGAGAALEALGKSRQLAAQVFVAELKLAQLPPLAGRKTQQGAEKTVRDGLIERNADKQTNQHENPLHAALPSEMSGSQV